MLLINHCIKNETIIYAAVALSVLSLHVMFHVEFQVRGTRANHST